MSVDTPFWDHFDSGASMTAAPVATAPITSTRDPARPGYATTEFWMATVVPTVVLFLSLFNIGHVDTTNPRVEGWIHLGAYLLAGLGYAFYAISRGHMKKGAAIALAIRDVFASNMPDLLSTIKTVAPNQVKNLGPLVSAIQTVDPQFSESQLEDLSNIIHGIMTHPQTKQQYAQMIHEAVAAAVKNVLGNADSPDAELKVAQTVQAVEDVVEGAQATTTPPPSAPVDINTGDGASFTAPQFP